MRVPLLRTIGLVWLLATASSAQAAITFDAGASRDFAAGTTWTHTCAADATMLYVGVRDDTGAVSGITYNGVAMTLVASIVSDGAHTYYLYRLVNPSSGSNTVSVSGPGTVGGVSASYKGVRKSSPNDVNGTTGPTSSTPLSKALTGTRSGNWQIYFVADRSGTQPTANSNTLVRALPSAATSMGLFDSNGTTITPGSAFTQSVNEGASTAVGIAEQFSAVVPSMLAVF